MKPPGTRGVTPDKRVSRQFAVISLLGFCRTFTGAIIGTGIAIFILVYWNNNFFSGLSASAIAITYMFSPVVLGRLSDRLGRKTALQVATAGTLSIAGGYVAVIVMARLDPAAWILVMIMVLRAMEGVFNGLFWPVLQASVSDASAFIPCSEDVLGAITRKGMSTYNAGWNGGVLAGQLVLSLFIGLGLLDECLMIMPVVAQSVNVCLAVVAFKVMNVNGDGEGSTRSTQETAVRIPNGHAREARARNAGVILALVFIFLYGFSLGGLATTTTNLFKAKGIALLVGIAESVRLVLQGVGVSKIELRKRFLAPQVVVVLAGLAAIMAVMSTLAENDIPIGWFLVLLGAGGLLFGIVYSEAINMIARDGAGRKRGFLMGLFESSIGIGFFSGPLLAGYLTQEVSYSASYLAIALALLPSMAASMVIWAIPRVASRRHGTIVH